MIFFRSLLSLALAFSLGAQSKFTIQYPPPASPTVSPASPTPGILFHTADANPIVGTGLAPVAPKMAQFEVEISPQSQKATKPTMGFVGVWTVGICNNSPASASITRTAILAAAPALHVLPDALAEDLMTRKAGTSKWSDLAAAAKEGGVILPLAIAADGIATNSKTTAYVALGAAVGAYLVTRATARVPNPAPYFTELLPATVTLPALQCSSQPYMLIADLMKAPATISLDMTVPQLP